MKTVRTMPLTHTMHTKVKRIEAADTTHVVPRSGLKRLGYTEAQRAQLRDIERESKQWTR